VRCRLLGVNAARDAELTNDIVREADRPGLQVPACRTVFCLAKRLESVARVRHSIATPTEAPSS
jgi:hypothetical protein